MVPPLSDEDVARHWDANANQWSDHVRRGWDAYREHLNNPAFFEMVGDVRGKTLLDAGCGEGYNTRLLARAGARVTGIDLSLRMIELAREEENRGPLDIRYEVASFSDLSLFGDAAFDAVISTMALMDGSDLEGALREFHRVLPPGGDLFFSITHPCFMTRGYNWLRDNEGNKARLLVSDYFDDEPWLERWQFERAPEGTAPFAIPVFPRTISDYVNSLVAAGFILREIREPRPSEAACDEHPWLRPWRDHAALFLHFHAVKPAEA
jgi:ubiquinone/menaquinone biosynthesis C-methylase UbiE